MEACPKCSAEMVDGYLEAAGLGPVRLFADGYWRKKNLGNVSCFFCPECGQISLHLADLSKLEKLEK